MISALAATSVPSARPGLQKVARLRDEAHQRELDAIAADARLRTLLDGFGQGLILFGPNNEVTYANHAGVSLLDGHHSEALVMASVKELVATVSIAGRPSASRSLSLVGPPRSAVEITVRLLPDGARIATVEDVTERRRLEDVRRDFVANISHELKTPIGALSLLAETLVEEDDPVVVERLAARIQAEALRVSMTIDDLLLLSRIESDESTVMEDQRVDDIVSDAAARLSQIAASRGIRIDKVLPFPPLHVPGDRRQLTSAVYNLLENAVKYSEDNSVVTVTVEGSGQAVELSVADCGVGIPARDLDRIFERFYRVDRARSRSTGGTGLGLAIVRHVAQNHGGQVDVRSIEGEGSTFTLTLPAKRSLPQ